MFGVRLVLPRVHRRTAVPVVLSAAILLIVAADQGIEGKGHRPLEDRGSRQRGYSGALTFRAHVGGVGEDGGKNDVSLGRGSGAVCVREYRMGDGGYVPDIRPTGGAR